MSQSEIVTGPYKVQVLDRAVAILEVLSTGVQEMSLGELTAKINLHKSTVHRLLMVLESHGLVDKSPLTGRYRLGLRLFELGNVAVSNLNLRDRARPRLQWLVEKTGETVHLCLLDRGEMLYLDKLEPERSVRISSSVGFRIPVYCSAVGKAVLAYMDSTETARLLTSCELHSRTPKTIVDLQQLHVDLQATNRRGYAIDDEETVEGIRCVSAPIFDYTHRPIAAVSVSGPTFRIKDDLIPELANSVLVAARDISSMLGAPVPAELAEASLASR